MLHCVPIYCIEIVCNNLKTNYCNPKTYILLKLIYNESENIHIFIMVASIIALTGPAQSGKTHYLLSRYRAAMQYDHPGTALWLAPTWRGVAEVRNHILNSEFHACWQPGVYTFDKFAQVILGQPIQPLTHFVKRQLMRHLIGRQIAGGRMEYFRPIALTGGLADLVCELIRELKRLEIWPEDFGRACRARGFTAKDRELQELYEAYQLVLRENQMFDAEGRFWSARDRLKQGHRKPFENLRLVVADGFTDFTRTQHEIFELLAAWVNEIIISLPLEPEPCRGDLFAKPLKTLTELKRRHGNLSILEIPRSEKHPWPALNHLEKNLFINPRKVEPAQSAAGIEILTAAKPQGELELVGAKIKRLIAEENARPGEIAVVFRSPQDDGGLAAEVFDRLGIPATWEIGQTLDRAPIMRALKSLLQLDLDEWPFRRLPAVLCSNYFQPDWPEWKAGKSAAIVEKSLRNLQIPRGRKQLLEQLANMRLEPDKGPRPNPIPMGEGKSIGPFSSDIRLVLEEGTGFAEKFSEEKIPLAVLNRLAETFDELPVKATLPQWAKAWEKLARQTGLLRAIDMNGREPGSSASGQWIAGSGQGGGNRRRDSEIHIKDFEYGSRTADVNDEFYYRSQDGLAWNRLMAALSAGEQIGRLLNRPAEELDRNDAFQVLLDILASERMPAAGDESGRVRVLSAASVRSLQVPYLFLAGLSEKAFPPPDREDRLYSEAEYLELIEQGLPLVARTERAQEEMLLFYEVLTRATRRLYLSYPCLDDVAQPLLPSPYLLEAIQAFGGAEIVHTSAADLSPVPPGDEPLSAVQFRVKAMADALRPRGDLSLFAGLLQCDAGVGGMQSYAVRDELQASPMSELQIRSTGNILPGLETIVSRHDLEGFGPAEGIFSGKAAKKMLAKEFSCKRCFTASELELYAACPFRFLVENILKLAPLEDITLQLDSLERGRIVHEALALFHRRINESFGRPASPLELAPDEFDRLLEKTLNDSLPARSDNPMRAALGEINRRLIDRWLAEYRRQCESYDKLWMECDEPPVPEFFEVPFGESRHRAAGAIAVEEPLEVSDGKETIRVSGRIDRIDTGKAAGINIFNILDYKTGRSVKFSMEEAKRGTALQLPLYALAAMELILNDRDCRPWRAGYWNVAKDGFKEKQSLVMFVNTDNGVVLSDDWKTIRMEAEKIVPLLVHNIRLGRFPVFNTDRRCTETCPLSTTCRIRHIRSLEKTWQPTN
jgi:ATP-dependent helicase/DNAse subunit B